MMHPPRFLLRLIAMVGLAQAMTGKSDAAAFEVANVTNSLGPAFFVDDAAIGGTDVTVGTSGASYNRYFSGLLTANQGPARISLTGFGFATNGSASSNTATALTLTITYLGADEAVGGGDDVLLGSAPGSFAYAGAGEYALAFDSPLSADLVITGTRFRIQITPAGGSVILKSDVLTYETATGPKLSVAGHVTPRRVNLAKYQPVTTDSVSGNRLALYVTDGSTGNDNRWESDSTGSHWARVDFPYPVEVGSAQVFTGIDDGSAQATFKIQQLSGGTWVDVAGGGVSGNTNVERNLVFTNPVTASSFRLYSSDGTLRVRELALYPPNGAAGHPTGSDLTLNLAHRRPATATANTAGNFALLATDGRVNPGSKWQTSTAGTNSLEIDLRATTKVGSAHLYSGSPGVAPLAGFVLQSWNGSTWQDIPGTSITGNSSDLRVITFSSPVTTSRVRLQFNNPGTTSVRELCLFPANQGNTGYPPGTGILGAPPGTAKFDDYADSFRLLTNASGGTAAVSNGSPAVNPPGVAPARKQYRVLLNLDNGTYRLHNRATGNCLSGASLSVTAGAPLVDAPYAGLPDQDWILSRVSATSFRLINAWSGLALDTQAGGTSAGTPLVQNPVSSANTQRWQISLSEISPKKGLGGASKSTAFRANWAYSWGLLNSATLPAGTFFQPMQWGDYFWSYNTTSPSTWKMGPEWRRTGAPLHLMGFNEPDVFSQSGRSLDPEAPASEAAFSPDRSLAEAIALWPRLQAMDLPLVSPVPADLTGGWLAGFYSQADALGYRVDYTAVHSYPGPGGGSSDGLVATLQTAYDTWHRPVWLTEFSFVDWAGNSSWSEEDNYNCLAEFLWRTESLPWLRKFALFQFTADTSYPEPANSWQAVTPAPRSNAFDASGNLTAFGKLYAAWDGDASIRPDKRYLVHNRDTRKRLASSPGQSAAAARNIRNDTSITEWTLVQAPTANRYYLTSVSDGRRLSYTSGGSVVLDPAGTTGSAVEWALTETQYGWFYLSHPATSRRLKMAYNNSTSTATYTMEATTNTSNAVQWRFIVPMPPPEWVGTTSNDWTNASNWMPNEVPVSGEKVAFNASAQANLSTQLNQTFSLSGLTVTEPSGPIAIGGIHTLTLGADGIDLSSATRDLTITAPLALGAGQSWNVATGRTIAVNGGLSGAFPLSIAGSGTVALGGVVDPAVPLTVAPGGCLKTTASGLLASSSSAVDPTVNGILDLNGTSQSVVDPDGTGVVDNTATTTATLTVGTNATGTVTLEPLLQNTAGPLALVKAGTRDLILPATRANTFSGGFTNNGTGSIFPKHNSSFGTGPVVINGSTIYATDASYTFANTLTLNNSFLRIGTEQNRTLTWSGPVAATGSSGISADGNTGGITLGGPLTLANATFTSSASGSTVNRIQGVISGDTGSLVTNGGTLQLAGANTYGGSTIVSAGGLTLQHGAALGAATAGTEVNGTGTSGTGNPRIELQGGITVSGEPVILKGTGNFLGALTSLGGENTWAGNVTLAAAGTRLGASAGATLKVAGVIDSGTNVFGPVIRTADLTATVTLSGASTYLGDTSLFIGRLRLDGGDNRLPPATQLAMGTGTASTEFDLNGRNQELAGISITSGATAANNSILNSSATLSTLTIHSAAASASSFAGLLKGKLALVKTGAGTLTLTGANTFTGDTTVAQGTLSLATANTASNASAVLIAQSGATLHLGFSGTDTVDKLFIGTTQQPAGVYGAAGSAAPVIGLPQLTGSGTLTVSSSPPMTGYSAWKASHAPTGTPADDFDGDGVPNGIEYVLGGTSGGKDLGRLPAAVRSNGNLVITFIRDQASIDGSSTLLIEVGDNLGAWPMTFTVPATDTAATVGSPSLTVMKNSPNAGRDTVTLTLPPQPGGKTFVRLRVTGL